MAGLTRRDGMQYNYQLNSFHPPIFTPLLSTFFADEYVYVYVVKAISVQTYLLLGSKESFFSAFFVKKIEKNDMFFHYRIGNSLSSPSKSIQERSKEPTRELQRKAC